MRAMAERRHEVTRLEGLSDAVFAVALTLLVVSLEVPKTMAGLMELVRGFLPGAVMFVMVCWIWHLHNVFFRRYGLSDALTATINFGLLFVVLFYVYPLKFVTTGGLGPMVGMRDVPVITDGATVMLLYSAGIGAIFLAFLLLYLRAWTLRDALGLDGAERVTLRYAALSFALCAGLSVVSILVALLGGAFIGLSGFLYFLIGPIHMFTGRRERRALNALGFDSRAAAQAAHAQR
jgi:uncharacterized membrane protein